MPADDQRIELPYFTVQFDPQTGAINQLADIHGKSWADNTHPLAWLRYQTFSTADYERFFHQYILPAEQGNGWSVARTSPSPAWSAPIRSAVFGSRRLWCYAKDRQLLFHLVGDPQAVREYGCPQFLLQYTFDPTAPVIQIDLQWFHKPACRLPEATWLSFQPQVSATADWRLDKLGTQISPLEVVENGNRHLHACGGPDKPETRVGVWTADLLRGDHPTMGADDFTIVEDTTTGKIVSSMNLIPQTWRYEGIPFGVGRPNWSAPIRPTAIAAWCAINLT